MAIADWLEGSSDYQAAVEKAQQERIERIRASRKPGSQSGGQHFAICEDCGTRFPVSDPHYRGYGGFCRGCRGG
jgi:hypothetical protein